MTANLAGKALRYLIGGDDDPGVDGVVTVVGYDATRVPSLGIGVKYCNLFDEKNTGYYAPYLHTSDTANEYDEGQIDPSGIGWSRNLREQFSAAKLQGFEYIELDNCDAYAITDVIGAINLASLYGLKVIAKNPKLVEGGSVAFVSHPNVFGIIVEKGAGNPGEMDDLRKAAGKPDAMIWFVFYGSARAIAEGVAIVAARYKNIGVTFSSQGEYGNSIDLLGPIPSPIADPVTRPSSMFRADANNRVANCLLTLYDQVEAMFPVRNRGNDGSIGDLAHQGTTSDHNPQIRYNGMGIISAIDITHDTSVGFDAGVFAESVRQQNDLRVEYVIWNGRIWNRDFGAGWRERNKGPGDHSEHVHISCEDEPSLFDDTRPWTFSLAGAVVRPGEVTRPKLKRGDRGPAVADLQKLLGIEADGIFGGDTDAAVRAFQESRDLFVDGIVGSHTWGLLTSDPPVKLPATAGGLSADTIAKIRAAARSSALANYSWKDRGRAPVGYIDGVAVTYGKVYLDLKAGKSSALLMSALPTGNTDKDALAWYGVTNITAGVSTLQALFKVIYGLGPRESGGNYSEGRDVSASNTSADTAEAGLFQQSWNSRAASSELPKLLAAYSGSLDGFLSIFREGVNAKATDTFGSGEGATFQALCKSKPAFAVECAAIGLRTLRHHWGPINRREVELRPEADALLQQVQSIVDAAVPEKPPPIDGEIIDPDKPADERLKRIALLVQLALLTIGLLKERAIMANDPAAEQRLDAIEKALQGLLGELGVGIKQLPGNTTQQTAQPAATAGPQTLTARELSAMLQQAIETGKPVAIPASVVAVPGNSQSVPLVPQTAPPAASSSNPSFITSILGLALSLAGNYFGFIPPAIAEPLIAATGTTAVVGYTGAFGMFGNLISKFFENRYAPKQAA